MEALAGRGGGGMLMAGTRPEGVRDGAMVGALDGALEGILDGALEGILEGALEGILEGAIEGALDGILEGAGASSSPAASACFRSRRRL
jgi:hypothetical protein